MRLLPKKNCLLEFADFEKKMLTANLVIGIKVIPKTSSYSITAPYFFIERCLKQIFGMVIEVVKKPSSLSSP